MRESTLWLIFIVCAIILIITASLHLMTFSSITGTGYNLALIYSSVVERSTNIFYTTLYIVFLGAALFHGLYGIRRILIELIMGKTIQRFISYFVLLMGVIAFVYGAYVVVISYMI